MNAQSLGLWGLFQEQGLEKACHWVPILRLEINSSPPSKGRCPYVLGCLGVGEWWHRQVLPSFFNVCFLITLKQCTVVSCLASSAPVKLLWWMTGSSDLSLSGWWLITQPLSSTLSSCSSGWEDFFGFCFFLRQGLSFQFKPALISYVDQAGLELIVMLLPQILECWDYTFVLPHLA